MTNWWEIQAELEGDEPPKVTYTNFIECQYCGTRFSHGDTGALNTHWRECKQHPAQAEIERLQAVNARLLAACEAAVRWFAENHDYEYERVELHRQLDQAITYTTLDIDQPGPRLPGLE